MKNIKEIILNNTNTLIYWVMALVLIVSYIWYTNTKINTLNTTINTKSNEEILIEKISSYKTKIDDKQSTIEVLKGNIQILQDEVKNSDTPFYNCYKTQLLRLADNIEYNIEYCKVENLEQFKGL